MSPAERIAWEHRYVRKGWSSSDCSCDPGGRTYTLEGYAAHIATVTEQAVREQMRAAGPTLEIYAYGATPEQADAIFTAAMDAAYDATPEGVAVDAVGKLAGHAAEEAADG